MSILQGGYADHNGYCQKCGKYRPRVRKRHLNRKKQKLDKIRKKERFHDMDIHDFILNDVFERCSKEYQTKPIRAARYKKGMENGFMVYFTNKATKKAKAMTHEGIRFFPTETEAWAFINANKMEYVRENKKNIGMKVMYDPPKPVLYRKDNDAINKDGIHFCFGKYAFASDQSNDYEFFVLDDGCWIIQDADGKIRVWDPDSEETFFGMEKDILYEVAG